MVLGSNHCRQLINQYYSQIQYFDIACKEDSEDLFYHIYIWLEVSNLGMLTLHPHCNLIRQLSILCIMDSLSQIYHIYMFYLGQQVEQGNIHCMHHCNQFSNLIHQWYIICILGLMDLTDHICKMLELDNPDMLNSNHFNNLPLQLYILDK